MYGYVKEEDCGYSSVELRNGTHWDCHEACIWLFSFFRPCSSWQAGHSLVAAGNPCCFPFLHFSDNYNFLRQTDRCRCLKFVICWRQTCLLCHFQRPLFLNRIATCQKWGMSFKMPKIHFFLAKLMGTIGETLRQLWSFLPKQLSRYSDNTQCCWSCEATGDSVNGIILQEGNHHFLMQRLYNVETLSP